jgi:hypothetical protein
MKYQNFQEYLNSKGNIPEPIVDKSGDHVEAGKAGKSATGFARVSIRKGKKESGKPFGDLGDKELKIDVDLEGKGKKAAKLPTAEFAKYELFPLIRETIEADPLITEDIVRELKRHNLLGVLIGELLEHRETYHHLAEIMGHDTYGPQVCRQLVRAMKEEVAPPFAVDDDDEEEDEEDDDFINRDTADGEGVDDEDLEDTPDEEPEGLDQGAPDQPPQQPAPQVPPSMNNLQQAMSRF